MSLNPVRVLKHEADEEKAETARLSSFVGAMAIGDLVKSTLGPKGKLCMILVLRIALSLKISSVEETLRVFNCHLKDHTLCLHFPLMSLPCFIDYISIYRVGHKYLNPGCGV